MLPEFKERVVRYATVGGVLVGATCLPSIMLLRGAAPDTWISWIVMGVPLGGLLAWAIASAITAAFSPAPRSIPMTISALAGKPVTKEKPQSLKVS
jgi:hypothetical protein